MRNRSEEPSATRTIISIREPGDALRSPSRTAATRSGSTIADSRGCRNPTRASLICAFVALLGIRSKAAITPAAKNSRRLVCRERSIVRCDGGRFTTPPPSRLEARSRLSQHSCSFDHLIGARQEVHRYRNAKVVCSLLIYDELKLIRSLNRKLARRRSPQYAIDVGCGLPILLAQVHTIRQQAADSCKLTERIDGG